VNGVHTLVFVQGSRATSRGKCLCGHGRGNTFILFTYACICN